MRSGGRHRSRVVAGPIIRRVMCLATLAAGCREHHEAAADAAPPISSTAAAAPKEPLHIELAYQQWKGFVWTLTLRGVPKGSKIHADDQVVGMPADGETVDIERASAVPPPKIGAPGGELLPKRLSVEAPDGRTVDLAVPKDGQSISYAIHYAIHHRETFRFGSGETAPAQHSIFMDELSAIEADNVIGPAKGWEQIDWVAASKDLPVRATKRTCGGYRSNDTGPTKAYGLELEDWEVTVYDRKTGAPIATKVIPADPSCPEVTGVSSTSTTVRGQPSPAAVAGWLRSVRSKR